jgi:4-hydroxybenzoate polyprenyltransferase
VTWAARLVLMMVRPPVVAVIFLFAAIGVVQGGRGDALHPLFTVIPLILGGWFIHATAVNDLHDEAIDRFNLSNARGRPLVSGDATPRQLRALGRRAAAVALVTAFAVNWRVGAVVTAGLALSTAYSRPPLRLCDRGALASLLLPSGYVAVPFLVGLFSVRPAIGSRELVLLSGLYLTFIGRILLKDFRDVRGDEMFGKRTFLVRHGPTRTCGVSAACWAAGSATMLLLFPWRSLIVVAFAAMLACALHGLRRLVGTEGYVAQQVVIGAIAQAGRGMGIVLLAHLTMVGKGWGSPAQGLVVVVLALLYAGMYAATLAERERVRAIRPF